MCKKTDHWWICLGVLAPVLLLALAACTAASPAPTPPASATPTLSATSIPYVTRTVGQDVEIQVDVDYVSLTREEMIEQADAIFGGTVQTVSPTTWNQDSGEYWEIEIEEVVPEEQVVIEEVGPDGEIVVVEDAIPEELRTNGGVRLPTSLSAQPVRQIELVDIQPLLDTVGLGEAVTLTILDQDAAVQEGDQIIVFARQTEIQWWDGQGPRLVDSPNGPVYEVGRREVLAPIADPAASALWLGEDGLYHTRYPSLEYEDEPISLAELTAEIAAIRVDVFALPMP